MRKNSKPPEERRRELVTVASRLFSEKGYEAVSVRDILDEVHGAPGMFYYYFKSKQDTYETLFAEDYAGPTSVLVSGDTTIEHMEYTIRLIYTGSAE